MKRFSKILAVMLAALAVLGSCDNVGNFFKGVGHTIGGSFSDMAERGKHPEKHYGLRSDEHNDKTDVTGNDTTTDKKVDTNSPSVKSDRELFMEQCVKNPMCVKEMARKYK